MRALIGQYPCSFLKSCKKIRSRCFISPRVLNPVIRIAIYLVVRKCYLRGHEVKIKIKFSNDKIYIYYNSYHRVPDIINV